jgi:competence ComEA-like helix-hairpin-helix protein
MMYKMKRISLFFLPLSLALALMPSARAQGLPDGEGRATYENVCGACHGADIVIGGQGTKARWQETVDAMRNRGAAGSDEDFETVLKYLSRYFGMAVNVNTAAAKDLETELGVTAQEAEAIVKYRTAAGNFTAYADLARVQGLDTKKLDLLKGRITFK